MKTALVLALVAATVWAVRQARRTTRRQRALAAADELPFSDFRAMQVRYYKSLN